MGKKKEFQLLDKKEVEALQDLQKTFTQLVSSIGAIDVQLWNLEKQKNNLKQQYIALQEKEGHVGKELEEKYGNGTISIEEGKFFPSK